ncbi:hypothetical protein FOZ63_011838 [Perkinsus olseni]|uniref:Uncharacterized protein n=1 Tax=Perkinsus olseni TaxID=32597 RepID=A0A7J6R453_PEROL|nr:hypothetical protein FOZ63_011838 [Perkinsus olseni]
MRPVMIHEGYRRGYLKRLSDHTISLEQDQFGWLHRLQDHLYFIQDALGVGYVVGEVLREVGRSPEERDLLVQYYKMVQSGGDVLEMDTHESPVWHPQSDVIFPLTVLERASTAPPDDMNISDKSPEKRRVQLSRDSLLKLIPYNFNIVNWSTSTSSHQMLDDDF